MDSFFEYFMIRIYDMKVKLPKIIISENFGAATIDALFFVVASNGFKITQSRLYLNHEIF